MLVVFSPIFVADTKIIFLYDFATPLKDGFPSRAHQLTQFNTNSKLIIFRIKGTSHYFSHSTSSKKPYFKTRAIIATYVHR